MNGPTRILLAEDEEIIAIIIKDLLASHGFEVTACADGQAAWERLHAQPDRFDLIILDRGLPQIDGIELLRRIKQEPELSHLPVIMETAMGDKTSIHEGLIHGAYYYLTKPFQPEVLLDVVDAALRQLQERRTMIESVRRAEHPLALLQSGTFRFRDLDEARLLANYLARACPDPERAIQGLQELVVNAVEHGNLGITYADKSALVTGGCWEEEVHRRLKLPEYRDRHVEVRFQRDAGSLRFTIQDQGDGFDWTEYLDFSPERAFDLHGRGIAMARTLSFDHLAYQGSGNTVTATIELAPRHTGSDH